MKKCKLAAVSIWAMVMLIACGGGSSSSTTTSTPTPTGTAVPTVTPTPTAVAGTELVGRFLDSAIEGLEYQSASYSGTTNANGEFTYKAGEETTFYLYGMKITTVKDPVGGVVTPADLAEMSLWKVLNVLRMVQTLDTDGDVSNGITLPTFSRTNTNTVDCPTSSGLDQYLTKSRVIDGSRIDWCAHYTWKADLSGFVTDANGDVVYEWADPINNDNWKSYLWTNYGGTYFDQGTMWANAGVKLFMEAVKPGYSVVSIQNAVSHFSETIGTVSAANDAVLTLPGKTATMTLTRPWCYNATGTSTSNLTNYVTQTYTFTDTGWNYTGNAKTSFTWRSGVWESIYYPTAVQYKCIGSDVSGTSTYSTRSSLNYLPCTSGICKYADVNRMESVFDDSGNLQYLLLTWYNDSEKTYHWIRKYMNPITVDGHQVSADMSATIVFN